jgi:hypothetical protein
VGSAVINRYLAYLFMLPINFVAVLLSAVTAFVLGFLFHGPIAGKLWMRLANIHPTGKEKMSDMYGKLFWNFVVNLVTDFILAVWLMDDGSLGISKNGKTYIQKNMILNTQGFQKKDVLRLSEMIKEKDIKCSIQKTSRNKKQSVIVIAGEKQCRKLVDIVKKYISQVSCMGYKIDLSRTGRV